MIILNGHCVDLLLCRICIFVKCCSGTAKVNAHELFLLKCLAKLQNVIVTRQRFGLLEALLKSVVPLLRLSSVKQKNPSLLTDISISLTLYLIPAENVEYTFFL